MQLLFWREPLRFKVPGRDLPDDALMQAQEEEVLKLEEYDRIAEEGWDKFYYEEYVYRITNYEAGQVPQEMKRLESFAQDCQKEWAKRGVQCMFGSADPHPFFKLSLARSMVKFTEDLYYQPEKVERALRRMTEETITLLLNGAKQSGIKISLLAEERASAFYYPLWVFEKFWWPYTVQIVDALWSEGIAQDAPDTDWGKTFLILNSSKGSFILRLYMTYFQPMRF
jgi:hypothetical protein